MQSFFSRDPIRFRSLGLGGRVGGVILMLRALPELVWRSGQKRNYIFLELQMKKSEISSMLLSMPQWVAIPIKSLHFSFFAMQIVREILKVQFFHNC